MTTTEIEIETETKTETKTKTVKGKGKEIEKRKPRVLVELLDNNYRVHRKFAYKSFFKYFLNYLTWIVEISTTCSSYSGDFMVLFSLSLFHPSLNHSIESMSELRSGGPRFVMR